MRKVFFFITLFAISTQIEAAVTDSDTTRKDRLNYKELNFLNNILGKIAEISFMANNFLGMKKYHVNKNTRAKQSLYPDTYFGAELKMKF